MGRPSRIRAAATAPQPSQLRVTVSGSARAVMQRRFASF